MHWPFGDNADFFGAHPRHWKKVKPDAAAIVLSTSTDLNLFAFAATRHVLEVSSMGVLIYSATGRVNCEDASARLVNMCLSTVNLFQRLILCSKFSSNAPIAAILVFTGHIGTYRLFKLVKSVYQLMFFFGSADNEEDREIVSDCFLRRLMRTSQEPAAYF